MKSIADAVLATDRAGGVTYLNPAAERICGWAAADAVGKSSAEVLCIVNGATDAAVADPLKKAMELAQVGSLPPDAVLIRRNKTRVAIEDSVAPTRTRTGTISGAVMVFRDVSKARALTDRLTYLAHHDALTGLPNRALFLERLEHAVAMARRHTRQLAVFFVDIDYFKQINDSLGHAAGDGVLVEIGRRLTGCIRSVDTVSRVGGDEFVVMLSEVSGDCDVMRMAEKLRTAVDMSFVPPLSGVRLAVSIGVSVYPEDGVTAELLLKHADIAMYHVKEAGRNSCSRFVEAMAFEAQRHVSIKEALAEGVRCDEFLLHYQPLIDLKDRAITGAEALIRWRHREQGVIYPAQFIGIAEESGIINQLGQWTLRAACLQARAWIRMQPTFSRICVNISAVEIAAPGFAEKVTSILNEADLDPRYLELEVTETAVMRDAATAHLACTQLAALGVRFAMDDFGTGYSSLRRLLELPFKTLKIDMSFVQAVHVSANARTIVNVVIGIGKTMGLCVVAEGVETSDQLRVLESLECDAVQGYFFSAPVEAEGFESLLKQKRKKRSTMERVRQVHP